MSVLPNQIARELRAHGKHDRLETVLSAAVVNASRELDSKLRWCERTKRIKQAAAPKDRKLAESQYLAACSEVEHARAAFERARAARDTA